MSVLVRVRVRVRVRGGYPTSAPSNPEGPLFPEGGASLCPGVRGDVGGVTRVTTESVAM